MDDGPRGLRHDGRVRTRLQDRRQLLLRAVGAIRWRDRDRRLPRDRRVELETQMVHERQGERDPRVQLPAAQCWAQREVRAMSMRRAAFVTITSAWLVACYIGGGGTLPQPDGGADASPMPEASADT